MSDKILSALLAKSWVIETLSHLFEDSELFYWRTSNNAELDCFLNFQGKNLGFEIKYTDAPRRTKSMLVACKDLDLTHLYVIYPGQKAYTLDERISVIPLAHLKSLVDQLKA